LRRALTGEDMKKVLLGCLFLSFITFVSAEENKEEVSRGVKLKQTGSFVNKREGVPPGMEIKRLGNIECLVPKGKKIYQQADGVFIVEGDDEFIGRKFLDFEERLTEINKEIEQLKKTADKLQRANPTFDKKE